MPLKTITTTCATCGNVFEACKSNVDRGFGRTCSRTCGAQDRKRRNPPTGKVERACRVCGKSCMARVKAASVGHGIFCSKSCWASSRTADKNPHWGGGRFVKDGYWFVRIDGRAIPEHRHIMQQHLGRSLSSVEHIHHIDENPLNNDIHNL